MQSACYKAESAPSNIPVNGYVVHAAPAYLRIAHDCRCDRFSEQMREGYEQEYTFFR
jgi:hypothetical protein